MEWIIKAIGVLFASGVILVVGGKYIIHAWQEATKEVERLKAERTNSSISKLNDEVRGFRDAINAIQTTVRDLNASLVQNRADVKLLCERLDDTKKMIERYENTSDDRMRNMIKSEVTELTKQLMLIRSKKI